MRFLSPTPDFTYATPEDAAWRRRVIHGIEQLTGKPRLWRLYADYCRTPAAQDFFAEAVERLALTVSFERRDLARILREGPLVVVANHPFGVVDGIVLGYLLSRVRPDFRILVNSVLYRLPALQPFLLPIDFAETRAAQATNLASRRRARADLAAGRAVAIFPGGAVSTAASPLGRAVDPAWKPFVGRLVQESRASVLPVFFEGQNSRVFQWASRVSMTLRLSLLFHEVVNKMGSEVQLRIGAPLTYGQLAHFRDRRALTDHLRNLTYAPQHEEVTSFMPPFEPPLGPVFHLR
ncbi:lysophospholipid acyltransferase family protein [Pelagibius marinus]|uniref:lysophospholipid acyltransferase family protein n=1 Tax=Pelagibius marinus TaxID=2762760 RepID=UPI0018729698|nr:lysophospholipid acyltransferase family protein [Pelagibius marinus]